MFNLRSRKVVAQKAIAQAIKEIAAEHAAHPDEGHTPQEQALINGTFGLVKVSLSMIENNLGSQFQTQYELLHALYRESDPGESTASVQGGCIFAFRSGLLGHGLTNNLMKPAALIQLLGLRARIEHPEWAEGQLLRMCETAISAHNSWIERS